MGSFIPSHPRETHAEAPDTLPFAPTPRDRSRQLVAVARRARADAARERGGPAQRGGRVEPRGVAPPAARQPGPGRTRRLRTRVSDGVTEWDRLSRASQDEIEQLVEVLKAVKQGDFSVRCRTRRDGILARAGELLNDIIGLNEHIVERARCASARSSARKAG